MLAQHQGLPYFPLCPPQHPGQGYPRSWGDTARVQPQQPQGSARPQGAMLSHGTEWKKHKVGAFKLLHFVFPSNIYIGWSPAFLEMAKHLAADGKQWMNFLFWFAWKCHFAELTKLYLPHMLVCLFVFVCYLFFCLVGLVGFFFVFLFFFFFSFCFCLSNSLPCLSAGSKQAAG